MRTPKERMKEKQDILSRHITTLMTEYHFSEPLARLVVERNWEDNHHSLYELENMLYSYADYADEIRKVVLVNE